jgi:hypothetical protein
MQLLDAKVTVLRDVVTQAAAEKTGGPPLERMIASLGANGLGFTSQHPLDIGTTVALHVVLLPQRESIVARGRVCQTHPVAAGHHVGVEFIDLPDHDQRRLTRHILKAEINRRR